MNWFSLELLPKHQEPSHYSEFGEVRILVYNPLMGMTMEMVKVEEFGESYV